MSENSKVENSLKGLYSKYFFLIKLEAKKKSSAQQCGLIIIDRSIKIDDTTVMLISV